MIEIIINKIAFWVVGIMDSLGYWGILILMALESANIPIPSEIILPYAGFMVSQGELNFHLAAFVGGLACLLGSITSYYLGQWLGRPFLWRYGKWLLISHKDIEKADKFIARYGDLTYFFSRLMPVIRTFISFIAGVSTTTNFKRFCFFTFIGSWIWSYILVYLGVKLGDNWDKLGPWWDRFQEIIIILILLAIAFHIFKIFYQSRKDKITKKQAL